MSSCIVDIKQIAETHLSDQHHNTNKQPKSLSIQNNAESNSNPQSQVENKYLYKAVEPENHQIRVELDSFQQQKDQIEPQQYQPSLQQNKEKCVSVETEPNTTTEMASYPFKNISKSTQNEFEKILDYGKSSNVTRKYLVFREINVNTQQIQETSQKIKKASKLKGVMFSNFNDFYFTQKKAMLQSIIESIDMSLKAQPEDFKKEFINSDYYTALEIFASKFQNLFRWNIFLLICQHLIIQVAFIIGLVKYYTGPTDQMTEFAIYLSVTLSIFTEIFLIKRSRQFLEKEGNDYFFIVAALVQAFAGIIAVSFEITNAPASTTTSAYLLFLFSYLAYILFVTVRILPQFEFLKDTFYNFIYTDPKQEDR